LYRGLSGTKAVTAQNLLSEHKASNWYIVNHSRRCEKRVGENIKLKGGEEKRKKI